MTEAHTEHRTDAHSKADEARAAAHKADQQRRDDEHKANEDKLAAVRKYADARRKEDERRAALKPEDRAAEDAKRAAMTPDEKAEDDEAKGLSLPPGVPTQFAATPEFPILTETPHAAEFVLSEANGSGSRDNVTIAIGDSVKIGQTLKITTPATTTTPAVATGNVTTDVAADAIALYNAPVSTVAQNIAVISRNAEVNGNLLYWPGTITAGDKNAIAKALAVHNIMARF